MAFSSLYYQQNQIKSEEYSMKSNNKRKRFDQEHPKTITSHFISDILAKETQQPEPSAKRNQTNSLFRPWLEEDAKKKPNNMFADQSNKTHPVMPPRPRRNRQHLIELIKRYNQEALEWLMVQQQFALHQRQQSAIMSYNIQQANYQRYLQYMALQTQEQLFVFGQQ